MNPFSIPTPGWVHILNISILSRNWTSKWRAAEPAPEQTPCKTICRSDTARSFP